MHNTTTDATQNISRSFTRAQRGEHASPRLKALPLSLSLAFAAAGMLGGAAHAAVMPGAASVAAGIATGGGSITPLTLPTGGTVVGGIGSINQSGASTVINQLSNKLALDWQTFNVGKDATVRFNQPSSSAVALNRIFDQNASQIFGHINANGQVFLINTNGIIFGSTAKLNVGGLVASTLDLTPKDFLADHYNLSARGGSAGVVNHGTIEAASGGSVSLVGGSVANDGLIVANYGNINLDGADHAVLDFDGNGLINIQVTGELKQRLDANAAVSNSGTLRADAGTVVLKASAAKDLFTQLVNNSGVITAGGINTNGGVVRLVGNGGNVENSGRINVSGLHGGSAQLLSDKNVTVTGSVDASGTNGGGSIRVGGGYQGGEGLQHAAVTYVGPQASLNADATSNGNGGSVVLWSDHATGFKGAISARGGADGGNGGSAEVSSHGYLDFAGHVDLQATHGAWGNLLLDPGNVTISSAVDSGNVFTAGGNFNEAAADADSVINTTTLVTQLGSSNVTISAPGTATGTGNIDVQNAIDYAGSTDRTLTLAAGGTVSFAAGATVSATGTGQLSGVLTGARGVTFAGTSGFNANGGNLSINGGALALGGTLTANQLTLTSSGAISETGGAITTNTLTGSSVGGTTLGGTNAIVNLGAFTNASTGGISLTNGGDLNVSGAVNAGTATGDTLNLVSGGAITQSLGSVITADALTGSSASGMTLGGANAIANLGTFTNTGTGGISLTNAGALNVSGDVKATGQTVNLVSGDAISETGGTITADTLTGSSVGGTTLGGANLIGTLGSFSATNFSLVDAQALTVSGLNSGGSISLTTTGSGNVLSVNEALNGGTVTLASGGDLTVNYGVIGTAVNLSAAGNLAIDAAVNSGTGTTTLTQTGIGAITQSTGSVITADTLTGSSVGSTTLTQANVIGNLGDFSAAGFSLINAQSLTVAAGKTVDGGSDGTQLTTTSGGLTIDGTLTGADISLTGLTGVALAGNISATGTLTLASTDAAITQSGGAITAGGSTTVNAGADAITLNQANQLTGAISLNGANTSVTNDRATVLGTSVVTGTLGVSSNGALSQAGASALDVAGLATFTQNSTAAGASQNIKLDQNNKLKGGTTFAAGTGAAVNNLTLKNIAATPGVLSLPAVVAGNLTLNYTNGTLSFPVAGVTIGGNLDATAGNGITLTDDVTTSGTQNYHSAVTLGNTVTLTGTSVDLTSGVTGANNGLAIIGNALLGATSGLTTLQVTGTSSLNGNISTSGAQTYTGAVTLVNDSALSSSGAGNIGFSDAVTGATQGLTVTTGGQASFGGATTLKKLTVNSGMFAASDVLTIGTDGLSVTTSAGDIAPTGAFVVTGASSFDAGTNAITLTNANNDFTGAVSLTGGTTQITDKNALTLGTLATGALSATSTGALDLGHGNVAGNLAATSNGGTITGGALTASGSSNLQAANGAITLINAGNHFAAAVTASGHGVSLVDSGNLTIASVNNGLDGKLSLTAGGSLFLPLSSIDTGTADLTLVANGGSFVTPGALSGGNITLAGRDALTLNSSLFTTGTASLSSSNGAINQVGGVLYVATLAGSSFGATTLSLANMVGTLGSFSAANFSLSNAQALTVAGPLTVSGSLSLTTTGALSVNGDLSADALTLVSADALDLSNNLTATTLSMQSGSNITQNSGVLTAATLTGSSTGDTTLSGSNQLDALGSFSAANFSLTNAKTLAVNGPLTVPGSLSLKTTAGALVVGGDLSANAVTLNSANDLDLAHNVNATTLALVSGGNISQSGGVFTAVALTGNSTGNTALNGANQLDTLGSFSAANLSLANAKTLAVNGPLTVPGSLSLKTTAGALTVNGALSASAVSLNSATDLDLAYNVNATTLTLTSAGNISQTAGALTAGMLTGSSTGNTTLNGANQLDTLGVFNAANFSLINAKTFAVNGSLTVPGSLSLKTTAGALAVNGDLSATSVSLNSATDLDLTNNVNASSLALVSGSNISQSGGVLTAGTLTGSSLGDTTLNGANQLGALGSFSAANFSLANAQALAVNGPLTVPGSLSLSTTSGALTLNGDLSATTLTLSSATDLDLAHNLNAQALALHSNANISQSGGVLTAATLTGTSVGDTTLNGANQVDTLGGFSAANFSLTNAKALAVNGPLTVTGNLSLKTTAGALAVNGALSANAVSLNSATNLVLAYNVNATTLALMSNASISQTAGVLTAGTLTGSSVGDTTLNGANQVDTLGGFSAANFSLVNAKTLAVNGPLTVPGSLSLKTTAGALAVNGDLSANAVSLDSAADLDLAHNVTATTLALMSSANISQSAGVLTAGTLTGSSIGGTTLNGANQLDTLGSFSAANFSLVNAKTLAVNGPLTVPGSLSLKTTAGALAVNGDLSANAVSLNSATDLDLAHNVGATTLTLTSAGNINQSGGVLTAATLTGSSIGDTTLNGANQVDTLGGFSAANFSLTNAKTLAVNGPLAVSGSLSLKTTAGALAVNGDLSASAVSLDSAANLDLAHNVAATALALMSGANISQSGGVLTAGTLTGSSIGGTTLNGANQLDTLGSFSAANFSLANAKTLAVNGPLTVPGSLILKTTAGALAVNGDLSANAVSLDSATGLDVAHNVTATTLALMSGANISQTGGVLTAGTLTGSSIGDTTLNGANQVDTLGGFSAANFSLVNAKTLAANGPLTVSGSLSLKTTAGALAVNGDLSANAVSLNSATDLDLAHNVVATTLALMSGANISQSGGVLTAGTLTGSSIGGTTLNGANQLDTLGSFSAANFSLTNAKTLAVNGPLTVPGSLSLKTTVGALAVNGDLSANAVSLDSATDLDLTHNVTATTLILNSNANISQSGGVLTAATLTGTSVGDTTLGGANQLDTLGSFGAANFDLSNAKTLAVNGPLTVPGNLSLTTTAGALVVNGDLSANAVSLNSATDLDLAYNVGATALTLTSAGNISQSGGVLTAATLTGSSIGSTALNGANQFDTLGSFSAADFSLTNAKALAVNGPLTVPGSLSLTTTSGALTLNGDLSAHTLTLTAATDLDLAHNLNAQTIALHSAGNINQSGGVLTAVMLTGNSTGDTTLTSANQLDTLASFSAANFSLTNAKTLAVNGPLTVPGSLSLTTTSGALTLNTDLSATTLTLTAATDLDLAHNFNAQTLALHSAGNISQSGGLLTAVTLTGNSAGDTTLNGANQLDTLGSFSAANFNLTNAKTLAVNGPLTVPGGLNLRTTTGALLVNGDASANSVSLNSATDLALAHNVNATTLMLTSGGNISQSGGVLTAGSLTGSSIGNAALNGANQFDTLGSFSAANLSLTNAKMLAVNGPLTVPGSLSLTTTGGDLSIATTLAANSVSLTAGSDILLANDVSANGLSLNAGGNISQSGGALTAATLTGQSSGDTSLTGANQIDVLNTFNAANFNLTNAKALVVNGVLTTPGTLQLTTTAGALVLNTDLTANTVALNSAADLALAHNINANALSFQVGGSISQLAGVLNAGSLTGSSIGDTILAGANKIDTLGTFSAANFTLTNAKTLAVNGPLTVPGTLKLTTTSGALSVDSDLAAGNLVLASATDLALAKNLAAATLSLSAGGNITQSAGVLTTGTLTGQSTGDSTLSGANLIDTLGTFSAANLNLVNAKALAVNGPLTVPGALTLTTTAGALALNTDLTVGSAILTSATDLALAHNLNAATLSLNAGGNISQSAGVVTAGTLTGQSTANTTLTGANQIDTLGMFSAANFSLANAKTLTVNGPVSSAGLLSLATTVGDLHIHGALTGGAVTLESNGDTELTDNVTGDSLALSSAGAINQTAGTIRSATLSGNATGAVALDQANSVDELGSFSAGNGFSLANAKALTITGAVDGGNSVRVQTTADTLTLAAGASVTGASIELGGHDGLAVNGVVDSGSGNITLSSAAGAINQGSGGSLAASALSGSSAGDTTLIGTNQVATLGNFTTGGNFSFDDARTLTVNNPLNVNGGHGDITLRTTGPDSDLMLSTNIVGGAVTLVSGRDLTQSGSRIQAMTLSGGAGRDAILTGANQIATLGNFSAASLSLANAGALAVGGMVTTGTGPLTLTTTAGPLSISGSVTGGSVSLVSASDVAINGQVSANTLALSSAGTVSQSANGAITASSLSGSSTGGTALDGANRVGTLGQYTANGFSFSNAGSLTVNGPVNGGSSTRLTTTAGDLSLNGQVSGGTTTLVSAGAVTEGSGGKLVAGELTGSSVGTTTLMSANSVDRLGAFSASGLNLTNSKSLAVTGPVSGGSSTMLTTTAGDIGIQAALSGTRVRLQSAGAITESSGGMIKAGTLSGQSVGASTFGTSALPIANQISVLGNFLSGGNFSLTNAQTLTLASVDGSAFTVDAGTSALYLSVTHGDLFQLGQTPLYDGSGTFSSTGAIGTLLAPIYVVGDAPQFVAMVGAPPAYFFALNRAGDALPLTGELSFNLPTSPLFGKSQNGNGRGDAYIDPSVISANYRSFGIVPSGILLPEDQQQCQPELEDCPDE